MDGRYGFWEGWWELLFPAVCAGCDRVLENNNLGFLCLDCSVMMAPFDFQSYRENPLSEHFWGRVDARHFYSMLSFSPQGKVQKIIHRIKYGGDLRLARYMGCLMGFELRKAPWWKGIDLIVPVPSHWRRRLKRGFNQSEEIARGLIYSQTLAMTPGLIRRVRHTTSQTGKKRGDRVDNLMGALQGNVRLADFGHILVIDDVVTTGATLEATVHAIREYSSAEISIACLALGGM